MHVCVASYSPHCIRSFRGGRQILRVQKAMEMQKVKGGGTEGTACNATCSVQRTRGQSLACSFLAAEVGLLCISSSSGVIRGSLRARSMLGFFASLSMNSGVIHSGPTKGAGRVGPELLVRVRAQARARRQEHTRTCASRARACRQCFQQHQQYVVNRTRQGGAMHDCVQRDVLPSPSFFAMLSAAVPIAAWT